MKETLDYLEEILTDDDEPTDIFIEPPVEGSGNISGEDDALEDGAGLPDDLCRGQLQANCELVMASGQRLGLEEDLLEFDVEVEDERVLDKIEIPPPTPTSDLSVESNGNRLLKVKPFISNTALPKSMKPKSYKWRKEQDITSADGIFPEPNVTHLNNLHPHELFEKFFDDILLEHIVEESERYASFRNYPKLNVSIEELRVYIGILICTGYNGQSEIKSLWSNDDDIGNIMIAESMRRDRFLQISKCIHFIDSNNGTLTDKMWKLRPLTDHLKAKFIEHFIPEQKLAYDESMIGYFGKHSCKQFIKGKPTRFGFKVWSLCTPTGYLLNFEIYQGSNPRSKKEYGDLFGKCAEPLVTMIDDLPAQLQDLQFEFYFDNLFTCFPLLTYLKDRGFSGTGTIRENRIPKTCTLQQKKKMAKLERGYYTSTQETDSKIVLTKWVDNAVVAIASTSYGTQPVKTTQRYSREKKKHISVAQPNVVNMYNKYMCGVDRMDQNISAYRIGVKGKKWWSSIWTWLIDASIQNAWQLQRKVEPTITQLQFRRAIAIYYCHHFGSQPRKVGRKSTLISDNLLRFDNKSHWVKPIENRRRCALENCKSQVKTICGKCDKGLCIKCFESYHSEDHYRVYVGMN